MSPRSPTPTPIGPTTPPPSTTREQLRAISEDDLKPIRHRLEEQGEDIAEIRQQGERIQQRLDEHSGEMTWFRSVVEQIKIIAERGDSRGARLEDRTKVPLAVLKWLMPILASIATAAVLFCAGLAWLAFQKYVLH